MSTPLFSKEPPSRNIKSRQSGFVLVIALSLMGFFVLLTLSLSTFTAMEIRTSAQHRDTYIARENALLGMRIALGRLQETVGPDQRFTANAGIINEETAPNMVGVWEKGDLTAQTWLVSGNTRQSPLSVTPQLMPNPTTDASTDEVFLVDTGAVNLPEDRIKVKKESIPQNSQEGSFAYWIGDEGQKVSVAINDEVDQLDYNNSWPDAENHFNWPGKGHDWAILGPRHDELRQMTPSITNFWTLIGLSYDDVATSENMVEASSLSGSVFLPGAEENTAWRDFYHSITPLSRAVLINHTTEDGELKKDLSDTPQLESALKRYLRERVRELPSGDPGFAFQPYDVASGGKTFPNYSVGPVMTEFVVRYNFYRYQGKLRVKQEMQLELWNPYAAPIRSHVRSLIYLSGIPDVTVTVDGEEYIVQLAEIFSRPPDIPVTMEWAPGEIKWVKGSGGDSELDSDGPPRGVYVLDSNDNEISIPEPTPENPVVINVKIPAMSGTGEDRINLTIQNQGEDLAVYRPNIAYLAVDVNNASPGLSGGGWMFGYAFEMDDELKRWIDNTATNATDPRRADMDEIDFADTDYEYWSNDPADTLGGINLAGNDTFNSTVKMALFDLPTQEPVSVGALTHVIGEYPYEMGNTWGSNLNDYFDRYYISTVPRWHEWETDTPPVLPNRYINFYMPEPDKVSLGDPLGRRGLDSDYLMDEAHAAKYLMMRGAFNINSVSVDAWRSMLSGISINDWKTNDSDEPIDLRHTYFRTSFNARQLPFAPNEEIAEENAFLRSGVTLTAEEIDRLAANVVAKIKTRGRPYESLSEFLNEGVIETAIAEESINQQAESEGLPKNSPAFLMQSDVINPIAPMLTPRSDTFVIRSYGDVTDPITGEVTAKAWCEAVVQRVPELTEPSVGTTNEARDPLTIDPDKYPFGRQVKIISFRYLTEDEV